MPLTGQDISFLTPWGRPHFETLERTRNLSLMVQELKNENIVTENLKRDLESLLERANSFKNAT